MKTLVSVLLLALLLTSLGRGEARQGDDAPGRLAALETELATLRGEAEERDAFLLEVQKYLQAQSEASKKMLTVIEQVASQGFTKGINFRSRETLLTGFRHFWRGRTQAVPGQQRPASKDKRPRRR